MRRSKLLALLLVVIAFTGTTITFAASSGTTSLDVTSSGSALADVNANPSSGTLPHGNHGGQDVELNPVIGAPDSVSQPGDLYLINATSSLYLRTTLYLDNPAKLSNSYSYFNLNVTVYRNTSALSDSTSWKRVNSSTLSLTNGYVTFNLQPKNENQVYAVSVSGGSFYADSDGTLSPDFFLEVRAG